MKALTTIVLISTNVFVLSGEISDFHNKQARERKGEWRESEMGLVSSTNHGVTEIGIERSRCLGPCPSYTFIARSDGTFRYKGDVYVERRGEFTGTISPGQFHRIAQFIKDSGYMELQDAYTTLVTDSSTTYTMVVMNGKRKTVSNYLSVGPTRLWAIEQLIDGLMAKAEWEGSPKPPATKK
jgi:uncharacterized protein DUF6438